MLSTLDFDVVLIAGVLPVPVSIFRRCEAWAMAGDEFEGGCQCGVVRYRVTGEPMMAAICHCSMCRRAHSAPAVAWALFEQSQVVFPGQPLRQFSSSDEAQRGFCADCGT